MNNKDKIIYEVEIAVLALVVGVSVVLAYASWNANKATSLENTQLKQEIVETVDQASTTAAELRKCIEEKQMYKFDYEVCYAQEIMINYLR